MLKDIYWSSFASKLTPANTKVLLKNISTFVDRNSEILLTLDLSTRYSFNDSDRAVVYDAVGISEDQMVESIKAAKDIYSNNKIQSNPFYITSMLIAGHYLNKKDTDTARTIITYMSLQMYVSLHKGFFKYDANKQVMDYTIAHLDSTYSIRQFPSIFAFIDNNSATVIDTYKTRIMKCDDKDLTWVIDATWTRLKWKLKKIASNFYENHESGRYLNSETDSYETGTFREMDNQSFAVDRLTNKVYIKLINRQYDKRFLKYSVTNADTSLQKRTNLIEDIIDGDGEDGAMRTLISSMIEFYLQQSGKPIEYVAKGDFIAFMKTAFGSNTEAPQMILIKQIIDKWLTDNMYKYGKAKYGSTAKTQYRRAIYMFFVFVINYEAKVQ